MSSFSQENDRYHGKRAAIYIRVSTDKQEEGYSFEFQKEKSLAWIEAYGCLFDEKHLWQDTHTGMDIFERLGLTAMRHAAKRHEFDILVMYKLDRFSRVAWQQEMVREELKLYGITTVTLKKDEHADDDSPIGAMIRTLYSFKAEEERNDLLQRTKDGQESKLKKGYLLGGGRRCYGYRWNGDGKERTHYIIEPEEAAVVHRIFRMYVHEGHSLRNISRILTEEGIPTPFRKRNLWNVTTLKKILTNVYYTGKAVYRKTYVVKEPGQKKRQVQTPEHEQVALPEGLIPRIIDDEAFEKAQQQLVRNKEQAARNNKHPQDTLLRCGLVICGYCGTKMRVLQSHSHYLYYRCWRREKFYGECATSEIAAKRLDAAVWEHALEIIRDPAQVTKKVKPKRQADPTHQNRKTIKKQLEDIAREIENCTKTHNESENETVRKIMAGELERLAKAQEGLLQLQRRVRTQQEEWEQEQQKLDQFEQRCAEMRAKLDDPTFIPTYAFKRDACEYFGLKAHVWRAEHEPHFQIDSDPPDIVSTSA